METFVDFGVYDDEQSGSCVSKRDLIDKALAMTMALWDLESGMVELVRFLKHSIILNICLATQIRKSY